MIKNKPVGGASNRGEKKVSKEFTKTYNRVITSKNFSLLYSDNTEINWLMEFP